MKVTDDDGKEETHNLEVEQWLYDATATGDQIDVKYDPDDARIAELTDGQVSENDPLKSVAASYVMSAIFVIMSLLFLGTAAMAWKGYDLKTDGGKLRLVPIGD